MAVLLPFGAELEGGSDAPCVAISIHRIQRLLVPRHSLAFATTVVLVRPSFHWGISQRMSPFCRYAPRCAVMPA